MRDANGMRPLPEGLDGVLLKQHREWLQRRRDAGLRPGLEESDEEHSESDDDVSLFSDHDDESLLSDHELDSDDDENDEGWGRPRAGVEQLPEVEHMLSPHSVMDL